MHDHLADCLHILRMELYCTQSIGMLRGLFSFFRQPFRVCQPFRVSQEEPWAVGDVGASTKSARAACQGGDCPSCHKIHKFLCGTTCNKVFWREKTEAAELWSMAESLTGPVGCSSPAASATWEVCVCVCSQSMFLPVRQAEVLWGLYVMFSPSFISEIHGNSVSGLLWQGLEESDQQAISWCARALWNRDPVTSWAWTTRHQHVSWGDLTPGSCWVSFAGANGNPEMGTGWRYMIYDIYIWRLFDHLFSMIFYVFPIRIATRLQSIEDCWGTPCFKPNWHSPNLLARSQKAAQKALQSSELRELLWLGEADLGDWK